MKTYSGRTTIVKATMTSESATELSVNAWKKFETGDVEGAKNLYLQAMRIFEETGQRS